MRGFDGINEDEMIDNQAPLQDDEQRAADDQNIENLEKHFRLK